MVHLRRLLPLGIRQNLSALELNVTGVPLVFIPKHSHEPGFSRARKSRRNRPELDRQVGVSIQDKKVLSQQRKRFAYRAPGSNQTRAIKRILQRYAKTRAVAKLSLDHFTQVSDAEHDTVDS